MRKQTRAGDQKEICLIIVDISDLQLLLMLAIMQTSNIKGRNEPLDSLMFSRSVASIICSRAKNSQDILITRPSSSSGVLSPLFLLRGNRL